jgi:hypothetical protein
VRVHYWDEKQILETLCKHMREKKSSKRFDAKDGLKRSHHIYEHHHEMQWTWLVHQKIGVMINIMCEQSYF